MTPIVLLVLLIGYLFWSDIRYRRISNPLVIGIAMLSIAATGGCAVALLPWLLVFAVSCVLFAGNILAGGDIKLILAFLPGIHIDYWPVLFLFMTVTGGVMACLYLGYGLVNHCIPEIRKKGLPYGVAIGLAGFVGVFCTAMETLTIS